MSESKPPSFYRIIDSDYPSAMIILAVVIIGLLCWLLSLMNLVGDQIYITLVIGLTVAALGLLIWRYWLIRRTFLSGSDTTGEIILIGFYRDRGRLVVTYTWQDQKFRKNIVIPKNDFTVTLHKSQELALLIDPSHPSRAFIRDLYLRK